MGNDFDLTPFKQERIAGERIHLRSLTADDVSEAYLGWMKDPETNRFLESRFTTHSLESLHAFVSAMADDPLNLLAGIFLNESGRHIGNIKLGPVDPHHDRAMVGLLIGDRSCWGRGFASEAISILTRFAFGRVGLHRLTAGAYADNVGSIRAFEKAGWRREGVLRSHWRAEGRYQDGISLGIVRGSA